LKKHSTLHNINPSRGLSPIAEFLMNFVDKSKKLSKNSYEIF